MYDKGQSFLQSPRVLRLRAALSTAWGEYRHALSLLTRLPVRVAWNPELKWGVLAGWFPAAGVTIGLLLLAFAWLWGKVAAPYAPVSAALLVALWAGITGGLHLDGWGDCADAFFTPVSVERRLEIMKDPHLGGFGTIGLILLLLCKYAGVSYVMTMAMGMPGFWRQIGSLWPLVAAPAIARGVMVAVLADVRLPLAKPGGMGAKAREGLAERPIVTALATAGVAALLGGWGGIAMFLAAAAAGIGFAFFARQRIGGITGDVLGGVVEIGETAALLALCLNV